MIRTVLGNAGVSFEFKNYDARDIDTRRKNLDERDWAAAERLETFPSDEDLRNNTYQGIILTGSPASVYDGPRWIKDLLDNVHKTRRDHSTKLIGICFGHQIISKASGGHCTKNPNGMELGPERLEFTEHGKAFFKDRSELEDQNYLSLLQTHYDHVPEIPAGFTHLVKNDRSPIQAMVSDDNKCLSFQGHPEFNRSYLQSLIQSRYSAILPIPRIYSEDERQPRTQDEKNYIQNQWKKLGTEKTNGEWTMSQIAKFINGDIGVNQ
ncbi:hypothetical protein DFQ30_000975 [Apophysomyces sp. BC1015]|nr:hypothetical protein DFQ30_000975 [Apophysomyces sp. BC1015]